MKFTTNGFRYLKEESTRRHDELPPLTYVVIGLLILGMGGCATLVNDPTVPIALSFSNGKSGECTLENKRAAYKVTIPATINVRRSDDNLKYKCLISDGIESVGVIPSGMEGAKLGASVLFFDFGITDAITDKHRTYPPSYVIPVR